MDAYEYLNQAYKTKQKIEIIEEKIQECKTLIERISPDIQMAKSKNVSQTNYKEDIIIKLIDYEDELKEKISLLIDNYKNVNEIIEQIKNEDHKIILRLHYINYKSWAEVSEYMDRTYQSIHGNHKKALIEIENILKKKKVVKI